MVIQLLLGKWTMRDERTMINYNTGLYQKSGKKENGFHIILC